MCCHIGNKLSVNSLCENLHDDTTENVNRERKLGGGQKHRYEEKCLVTLQHCYAKLADEDQLLI